VEGGAFEFPIAKFTVDGERLLEVIKCLRLLTKTIIHTANVIEERAFVSAVFGIA